MTTTAKPRPSIPAIFAIGLYIMLASGCNPPGDLSDMPLPRGPQDGVGEAGEEVEAIRRAAAEYVRRETDIREVIVEVDTVAEGWARVRVLPADDVTDPAVMYVAKQGDTWRGIAIGTGFTPEDLDEIGVPAAVRPSDDVTGSAPAVGNGWSRSALPRQPAPTTR